MRLPVRVRCPLCGRAVPRSGAREHVGSGSCRERMAGLPGGAPADGVHGAGVLAAALGLQHVLDAALRDAENVVETDPTL